MIVVAIGGNAIDPTGNGVLEEQRATIRTLSVHVGRLARDGHRLVITHGNGPQVGEILARSELSRSVEPPLTLDVAGAMSQGQLGYLLQQELGNFLRGQGYPHLVCTVITQVEVDPHDSAFQHPAKPIGRFYSESEAARLRAERGWEMVEDSGRGYRRVVPSPRPQRVVEAPVIRRLSDRNTLVIAAGGGGLPVVRDGDAYRGAEAVIDKDRSAQLLATELGADILVLLTAVPAVSIYFGTARQRSLGTISAREMQEYLDAGHFPPGSMQPKAQAAIDFVEAGGKRAIITSAACMSEAMSTRQVGTHIVPAATRSPAVQGEKV